MKVYAGAPAAARHYVEVGRARADDYYLAEGTGLARRFTATDGHVTELAPLTGDGYETWVAGRDPDTGQPRGRLREDARAGRFVEVVVNGPKSWSLAAALHPDIAAAYEGAQDRAAAQILGWVSQHATTRVGPRGAQVPVPLQVLEAASVRHYTSRAGDPHWHLHLQVNARVYAADKWRGLFTVDVRDSLGAINGIGHAAMATDPELNAALAKHGYSKDASGEIRELAEYVGPFSARHQQIARNAGRYEREWAAAQRGEHAGPALRRSWDARAWAEDRPDKITPQPGEDLRGRWQTLLADLGYRSPTRPVDPTSIPVGALNRDLLAARALVRLAAGRSAWNPADVRGEVERLIAEAGVVTEPGVRIELAEDLTARALDQCVLLVGRDGVPEHIRAWTSPDVLGVEADLTGRLATRATLDTGPAPNNPPTPQLEGMTPLFGQELTPLRSGVTPVGVRVTPPSAAPAGAGGLDAGQAAAAAVLAGDRQLVVVEGAAGAGKTTTLAAARDLLAAQGRRLVVVTPTWKGAQTAGREVGVPAGSAAGLAHRHGWRWDDDGAWTRLAHGQADPLTGRVFDRPTGPERLGAGDLLVVDEAGMLDQDTARALLTVADEAGARLALLGDRHQLAAVGRGGVLDLAVEHVDPTAHVTLDGVHRFVRPDQTGQQVPDRDYAALTLAMRAGTDPGAVFDALVARGQIRLHYGPEELQDAIALTIAESYRAGQRVAVVVDTREQANTLNEVIRGYLVYCGQVDDTSTATGRGGQQVGVGDLVSTRRNDRGLGVANRDTWTITAVHPDGSLTISPAPAEADGGQSDVATGFGPARVLPPGYVREHVELAYASTAHGVQGDTLTAAHLVVGEHTGAAAAYVGMTRGRQANTAHLIAPDMDQARQQWIAAFARDKADLGPSHAGQAAALAAADFAPPPAPTEALPPALADDDGGQLEAVLGELFAAWSEQHDAHFHLRNIEHHLSVTEAQAAWREHALTVLTPLQAPYEAARTVKEQADRAAAGCQELLREAAGRIAADLREAWDVQQAAAEADARIVAAGPGRLGLHRARVADATMRLDVWAHAWAGAFPGPDLAIEHLRAHPGRYSRYFPGISEALDRHAQRLAAAQLPEQARLLAAAERAEAGYDRAADAYFGARRELDGQSWMPYTYDTGAAKELPALRARTRAAQQRAEQADQRVAQLCQDPMIGVQPDPTRLLSDAHTRWEHQYQRDLARAASAPQRATRPAAHRPAPGYDMPYTPPAPRGPGIGR